MKRLMNSTSKKQKRTSLKKKKKEMNLRTAKG